VGPCQEKNIIGSLEDICNDFQPCPCLWLGAALAVFTAALVRPSFPPAVLRQPSLSCLSGVRGLGQALWGGVLSYFKKSLREGAAESKFSSLKCVSNVPI